MSPIGKAPKNSPVKQLPHQAALAETFFNPASKRVICLRGDVGLGKSTALVALSGRLLQQRPTARVLFLVPAALRLQTVEMLRDAGAPALLVDRYRFREMLDSTTEGEIWPSGVVAVLGRDFAKQPDVRDSLAKVRWTLVIVDEVHSFGGARTETLRQVGGAAERVILTTLPDTEPPSTFPAEHITMVEWKRHEVVDHDGTPLDLVPRPRLHEVPFSLSPSELNLHVTVRDLCQILGGVSGAEGLRAMTFFRSFESSPAALESTLQKFAERLATLDRMEQSPDVLEDEMVEDMLAGRIDRSTAEKAAAVTARALQEIEAASNDSKLAAFGVLLNHLKEVKIPSRRICVLTDYLATLYYPNYAPNVGVGSALGA